MNRLLRNFADLPRAFTFASISSGLVAVLVGYAGPMLLIFQAAEKAHLSQQQLSTWIWAVAIGCGVCALMLSLWYRQPVLVAWPTAGTALLITSLGNYRYEEAIGAFLVSGVLLTALGLSGTFGRIMARVPKGIVSGMLGGVLLKFGIALFTPLPFSPVMIVVMTLAYLLCRRLNFKAPTIAALIVGLILAGLQRDLHFENFHPALTVPSVTWPAFSLAAVFGLALPLTIVTVASQHAPGVAVLRSFGYDTPADGPITLTGLCSILLAPFGAHNFNLAAITAAICLSPDAHPDAAKRYSAGVSYGFWYILFGLFGATAVAFFTGLPKALVSTIAGLALTGAIANSLTGAMAEPREREAALIAFLLTASDISLLGVGAAFWGLVAGGVAYAVMTVGAPAKKAQ